MSSRNFDPFPRVQVSRTDRTTLPFKTVTHDVKTAADVVCRRFFAGYPHR